MSICSAVSGHRGSVHPEQEETPCKLLPQELCSASQHQAPPLPTVSVGVSALSWRWCWRGFGISWQRSGRQTDAIVRGNIEIEIKHKEQMGQKWKLSRNWTWSTCVRFLLWWTALPYMQESMTFERAPRFRAGLQNVLSAHQKSYNRKMREAKQSGILSHFKASTSASVKQQMSTLDISDLPALMNSEDNKMSRENSFLFSYPPLSCSSYYPNLWWVGPPSSSPSLSLPVCSLSSHFC